MLDSTRLTFRVSAAILVAIAAVFGGPAVAHAAEPISIAHEEQVMVGPYDVTVGFSRWPLTEGVSFDMVMDPAGGIIDRSGTISIFTPSGSVLPFADDVPLTRHPRQRESWGLDVVSFQDAGAGGRWSFELAIDGDKGPGVGRVVAAFDALPGPSQDLSWAIAAMPTLLIWGTIVIAWIRIRPGRQPGAWSLGPPTSGDRPTTPRPSS